MSSDCLFCKIAAGEIPSTQVYSDDTIYAFYDIKPEAPVHFLVIPRKHITSAAEIDSSDSDVTAHIFEVIAMLSKKLGLSGGFNLSGGFRIVSNCGADAGQSVAHLHFHVLAGRHLSWPPG